MQEYPHLFAPFDWGVIRGQFRRIDAPPPAERIGNVNIVPFVGDRWLVIHLDMGSAEIPGGTLENGETFMDALRRELREEAGARLHNFRLFGLWDCHSTAEAPYRPHLPHPGFYRVVGYGAVEINGKPLNPAGDEQVVRVELLPLAEAVARFEASQRPGIADLYRLAAHLRADGDNF